MTLTRRAVADYAGSARMRRSDGMPSTESKSRVRHRRMWTGMMIVSAKLCSFAACSHSRGLGTSFQVASHWQRTKRENAQTPLASQASRMLRLGPPERSHKA